MALIAQSTDLPADMHQAAQTCAAAVRAIDGEKITHENTAPGIYLAMLAARTDTSGGSFNDRLQRNTSEIFARSEKLGTQASSLVAQCRKRFPLAFATKLARALPADRFERGFMCIITASMYLGISREAEKHGAGHELVDRLTTRQDKYMTLLPNSDLATHGLKTQADFNTRADEMLAATLDYGNLGAVFAACEAAYPD